MPKKWVSFLCMSMLFGFRPLVKGALHSFYDHNPNVLFGLMFLDLALFLLFSMCQIFWRPFKCKSIFCLTQCYLLSVAATNMLLILNADETITGAMYESLETSMRVCLAIRIICPCLVFIVKVVQMLSCCLNRNKQTNTQIGND